MCCESRYCADLGGVFRVCVIKKDEKDLVRKGKGINFALAKRGRPENGDLREAQENDEMMRQTA